MEKSYSSEVVKLNPKSFVVILNVDCFNFANLNAHRNAIHSLTNLPSRVKTKRFDESLVLFKICE